ncbi:MAG TPA: M43 family zinc metalloprotease, partial [Chitinophagaceae bacterium]
MKSFYTALLKPALLILLLLSVVLAKAQSKISPATTVFPKTNINAATQACGTDLLLTEWRKNPAYRAREEAMNRQILIATRAMADSSFLLPVVFHIIDPNPASITDVQVIAALQNLNDAFGKTGPYAASAGADTKIQFCLAQKDPDGGTTTGITRTSSMLGTNLNPVIDDDKLKSLNDWDPSRYINIWIVSSINTENLPVFRCGVWTRLGEGGYATLPPSGGVTDGIVLAGISPGPGLAHEMGHYLGLYHTFEGLNCVNNNCMTDGDRVCDTPPDASTGDSPSCGSPENSCTTDTLSGFATDQPDLISDIMDYGNYGCHIEFTEGQAARMRAAIVTQRSGLLENECDKPCAEASVAAFTRDNASPLPGDLVNFTNGSTGASNYAWLINDVVITNTANFSNAFAAAGEYKVTLRAYNADASCFSAYTDYVFVTCGVTAKFYTDKRTIASLAALYTDSISFTNTSVNGVSYKWLQSFNGGPENVVSTALNYKYVFPTPGNYTVRLVASNGGCSDTTEVFSIPVADPTQDGVLYFNDVECYQ